MLGWLGFILLYAFFFVIIYYYTPGTGRVSTGPRSQCLLTELTPHLITEPKPLLYTSCIPVLSFKTLTENIDGELFRNAWAWVSPALANYTSTLGIFLFSP